MLISTHRGLACEGRRSCCSCSYLSTTIADADEDMERGPQQAASDSRLVAFKRRAGLSRWFRVRSHPQLGPLQCLHCVFVFSYGQSIDW